jgi:hypothetical protein
MSDGITVEALLRWRLTRAEGMAPPPPRAADLLDLVRPWWERWPDQLRTMVERLGGMQVAYGYALALPQVGRLGFPVPTLIARPDGFETFARVLYLSARDGWLRLRFQLDGDAGPTELAYDVTLVSESGQPILWTRAVHSMNSEYRLDAEIDNALESSWDSLRATDRMPFRLILHPAIAGA